MADFFPCDLCCKIGHLHLSPHTGCVEWETAVYSPAVPSIAAYALNQSVPEGLCSNLVK